MKELVGKFVEKQAAFIGEKVTIRKLTVNQVMKIQEMSKAEQTEESNLEVLAYVITNSVKGADTVTLDELKGFPLDELSNLSQTILEFSGLGNVVKS